MLGIGTVLTVLELPWVQGFMAAAARLPTGAFVNLRPTIKGA